MPVIRHAGRLMVSGEREMPVSFEGAKPNVKPAESRRQVRIRPVASGSLYSTVKAKCEQWPILGPKLAISGPKRAEMGP